jgi:hypothetical protein
MPITATNTTEATINVVEKGSTFGVGSGEGVSVGARVSVGVGESEGEGLGKGVRVGDDVGGGL